MNAIANRPFPLKKLGFKGYSTFLDGLILPEEVLSGPHRAEGGISPCETFYVLNPEVVKFRGGFDISSVWGTDRTEGIKVRLWAHVYESDSGWQADSRALEFIWSWMDSEPRELCFLKAEMKTMNIAFASASYSILLLSRAQKLWPKDLFNTERWRGRG